MAAFQTGRILQLLDLERPWAPTERDITRGNKFLARFPELRTELEDYRANPRCETCQQRLMYHISQNRDALGAFIRSLDLTPEQLEDLQVPVENRGAGRVFDISNTPEAYRELLEKLDKERYVFRGLTVGAGLKQDQVRVYLY
jgi:hypothetical protein